MSCFGVSFDGRVAFPSVDRDILIRELYTCGEDGDLLLYCSEITLTRTQRPESSLTKEATKVMFGPWKL